MDAASIKVTDNLVEVAADLSKLGNQLFQFRQICHKLICYNYFFAHDLHTLYRKIKYAVRFVVFLTYTLYFTLPNFLLAASNFSKHVIINICNQTRYKFKEVHSLFTEPDYGSHFGHAVFLSIACLIF